ncbi:MULTISPECIES: NAD-dependent epimerase/dehydratase family protein [unclassified Lentimonas]|uniref:NAD-dependent epimerase/dehydratase family protein n=1 Tax=unclassified Lentimonas TaxID=2630993 RepID=UPI0013216544|nr:MULTISPECIES: NAD-dependent epimerase/dehydratase family protein [unclassified Lentimonas]CAA6696239.1 Unannotated [Lentimonas sp. CC10]CAA6697501.1 Unannotated [Lentimonas sp. CC19]CAA7071234.1 Unannotated [Lentimonas sp. CC11]
MNILLTGCAGFIGSHVLDRLLNDGHQVVGIDNFAPDYPRAIKEQNIAQHCCGKTATSTFTLLEADLTNKATFTELDQQGFDSFDAIIHLADRGSDRASIDDPAGYLQSNVVSTQNLLEYAKDHEIPHFIHASSNSVYGLNSNTPWLESETDLEPISPYALTKINSEQLGHTYSQLYDIRVLALRLPTIYGPRQRPDQAIYKFTHNIIEGETILMHGEGDTLRDYTHVDDIVDGIIAALHYNDTRHEIINLGNTRTVEFQEMVAQLEQTLGVQSNIEQLPELKGDVPLTLPSIEKAARLLGYTPSIPFEAGITDFVKWMYDTNPTCTA